MDSDGTPFAEMLRHEYVGHRCFGRGTGTVNGLGSGYHRTCSYRHGVGASLQRGLAGIERPLHAGYRCRKSIVAVGVTEPGAGSDVKGIGTTARREGDGYVLNGARMFITNGVHADLYCIAAVSSRDARPSQRMSIFLVEKGTPGFRVGRALDKQGWRSSDTAELLFEDCRIPATNLLGEEGRGFYAIMRNFQNERIVIGAMAMGEAQAAIEITLDWVTQRQTFGAPLWSRQAIRHRLAMLAAKAEAGRQLVYHAAWLVTQGIDATKEVSMVKAYCGELVNEVMYTCLQFHGGMGYMRESTIERMSRDARVQSIGGGATEVMLEEVAKRMR